MAFSIPTNELRIEIDRSKLLMSDALRGRVPALESDELADHALSGSELASADQSMISELDGTLAPVTLVIERKDSLGSSQHLIGSMIAVAVDRKGGTVTATLRLPIDDAWSSLDLLQQHRSFSCGDIQAHRGEEDPVLTLAKGPLELVSSSISDVTSVFTCTLTLCFRTSSDDT